MLIERRSSSHAPAELSEAGIGRAAVKGAIIGYFAVLMIVAGIVLAAGAGLGVALAVGAYVAIWGGPGWGGMIGAQRYADRIADDERSVARQAITEVDLGERTTYQRSRKRSPRRALP
jgi:hypothetical protein